MQQARSAPILKVQDLAIAYETRKGDVQAVRNVSFDIRRGETLGIVGESGCGKSTVAFGIVNFLGRNGRITNGRIVFQGQDLVGRSEEELRRLRGDRIAMVYQDPMQALNPSLRIGEQMAEVLIVHRKMKRKEAEERCIQMLQRVYMPDPANVMRRYPRPAAARGHRHGPAQRPRAPHHGRADDGPGRYRGSGGAGPGGGTAKGL